VSARLDVRVTPERDERPGIDDRSARFMQQDRHSQKKSELVDEES
jgi:hypothetical protein